MLLLNNTDSQRKSITLTKQVPPHLREANKGILKVPTMLRFLATLRSMLLRRSRAVVALVKKKIVVKIAVARAVKKVQVMEAKTVRALECNTLLKKQRTHAVMELAINAMIPAVNPNNLLAMILTLSIVNHHE